ncbi:MAG: RNA 2',3'-cyclic phosphodiesterase [Candidatus Aenigmatarchaeota archaeon]
MVRAFIGVVIPDDIKRYVIGIQDQLKSLPIETKFVEPENLHISLSFLGDVEDAEVEKIKFKLDEISKSYAAFEIIIGNIILIPNEKFTRVVALDVKNDVLEAIRKDVVKSIGGKSHSAHLTLARVKVITEREKFIENVNKIVQKEMRVKVDGICLVESVLRENGPVYKILHKSHLK